VPERSVATFFSGFIVLAGIILAVQSFPVADVLISKKMRLNDVRERSKESFATSSNLKALF
jgi:hypothetical protein